MNSGDVRAHFFNLDVECESHRRLRTIAKRCGVTMGAGEVLRYTLTLGGRGPASVWFADLVGIGRERPET